MESVKKHAFDRSQSRDIWTTNVLNALKDKHPEKGNAKNRVIYSSRGTKVVFDRTDNSIVSVKYTGKK